MLLEMQNVVKRFGGLTAEYVLPSGERGNIRCHRAERRR